MKLLIEAAKLECDAPDWEKIPFDAPHQHVDILRRLYDSGQCTRCDVMTDKGVQTGSLYYQVEQGFLRELVVLGVYIDHSEAAPSNVPLLNNVCDKLANKENCVSVRFHTVRAGMVSCALHYGWRVSEIIMRRDAKHSEDN